MNSWEVVMESAFVVWLDAHPYVQVLCVIVAITLSAVMAKDKRGRW